MATATPKQDIRNLSFEELSQHLQSMGEKAYRATQIYDWIYQKGIRAFGEMSNLQESLRKKLQENFVFMPLVVVQKQVSQDGTTKYLFDLDDHQKVETVLIPTATRTTACVSTQAGCKFGCKFCASGIGGWVRNLTCSEIIAQILHVKQESKKYKKPLTHIVFMGVGEPLDNYDNLLKAIRLINDKKGINIGARRITISTCGVIPKIKQLAQEGLQVELAISLHGYDNPSRNVLMPVNRRYPFNDLIEAVREYVKKTKRQVTFEYILIKGITCTQEAARQLGKSLKGMNCKMNLIPYNPIKEFDHRTPSRQEITSFRNRLEQIDVHATIRKPRGRDVAAACGQLRNR